MSLLQGFLDRHTRDVHAKLCGFDGDLYVLQVQPHVMAVRVQAEEYIPKVCFNHRYPGFLKNGVHADFLSHH